MAEARTRTAWQRLADVPVPKGILWVMLLAAHVRQRHMDRAIKRFDQASSEFGTFIGTQMREGDQRNQRLLDLQSSVERFTRWLVALTVLLGIIGLASIGTTIWAAVR